MKTNIICCPPLPLTSTEKTHSNTAIPSHLLRAIFNLDHVNHLASTMTPQAAKPLNERGREHPHEKISLIYTLPTYTTCTTTALSLEEKK